MYTFVKVLIRSVSLRYSNEHHTYVSVEKKEHIFECSSYQWQYVYTLLVKYEKMSNTGYDMVSPDKPVQS